MNTRITYFYCDGGNNKTWHELDVQGKISFSQVEPFLECRYFFIPSQIGLPDLQNRLGAPTDDDHVWHHFPSDAFTPTADPPTICITARILLKRFHFAFANGWDVSAAMDRNNLKLSPRDFEQLRALFSKAGYSAVFDRYMEKLQLCPSLPLQIHTTPQI